MFSRKNVKVKKNKIEYRNMWLFFALITLGMITVTMIAIPYVLKGYTIYTDFLVGETAYIGSNKSGEWNLFWGVLLFGSILAVMCAWSEKSDELAFLYKKENKWLQVIGTTMLCALPCVTHLVFYGKTTGKMLFLTVLVAGVLCVYKKRAINILVLFICTYFCVETVSVLAAIGFSNYFFGDNKVLLLTVLLFLIFLIIEKHMCKDGNEQFAEKLICWVQIPIPLLLAVYLKNDYATMAAVHEVKFPLIYVLIVILLIVGQIVANLFFAWKKAKHPIFVTTVFSIFAFVSYVSPAMIMPFDLHHHGEQLLAWQQIVELGQRAYDGYAPASGLFPMIIGAINSLFFGGNVNAYAMSYVLFMLMFEALIISLLWRRIGGRWTLFISVLCHMPIYCRTWIILPALLILTDKKCMAQRLRWLLTWVMVCFLCGLYYPLYGGAILIATLPYGISQFVIFCRNKEWKQFRNAKYLICGLLLLILVVFSLPLLYRMLMHILSMGGQTLAVDGETVLNAGVPEWFMPYMRQSGVRTLLYYLMRLGLGAGFAVGAVYITAKIVKQYIVKRESKIEIWECLNQEIFGVFSPVPILLVVSFTYTMVCMDENWVANILSRSAHVILFVCAIYGVVLIREYGKEVFGKRNQRIFLAIVFAVPFIFFCTNEDYQFPFMEGTTDEQSYVIAEYQSKLYPYEVKEGYEQVTPQMQMTYPNVDFERIGEGYVRTEIMDKLAKNQSIYDFLKTYDCDVKILGFEMTQMYYFMLNEKAVYSGRTAIAKSAKATQPVIDQIDEHTVVRTGVIPLEQYYLYRYLVLNGYVYSHELEVYLPSKLYQKIYGAEGTILGSPWANTSDCAMVANSFGKSLESMETMETCGQIPYECDIYQDETKWYIAVRTQQTVSGADTDFVKVLLNNCTSEKVTLRWKQLDSGQWHEIICDCGDGNLLIPVGSNASWLIGEHTDFEIVLEKSQIAGNVELKEFAFYHLK